MPGHTPLAPGTHGSYMDNVRRAGSLLALQVGDLGHHVVILVPLLGELRGLRGLLRMIGISVACHTARPLSPALLHQPLGNLQDTR